jgi:hypothetical protein
MKAGLRGAPGTKSPGQNSNMIPPSSRYRPDGRWPRACSGGMYLGCDDLRVAEFGLKPFDPASLMRRSRAT